MTPGPAHGMPGMQVDAGQSVCPACGASGLAFSPILHHMICAYVAPQGDFTAAGKSYTCPKCRRGIVSGDDTCEIVGTSARCAQCRKEFVVSPPTVAA